MKVQLDRFEDNGWAVLMPYPAGDKTFDVPREALPSGTSPGDVLDLRFEHDRDETLRMADENRRLMDELLRRDER